MSARLPVVGITVGDPAGIGPEIARRKAAADPRVAAVRAAPALRADDAAHLARFTPGDSCSAEAGRAAYDALVAAVDSTPAPSASTPSPTAPVNKEAFALAGRPWKGHTDLLGHRPGAARPVMFDADQALATVHIALADADGALTPYVLAATIRTTADALPGFGYPRPRLAVAGLNPHCGEHGLMGHEDDCVIAPVVALLRPPGSTRRDPIPG